MPHDEMARLTALADAFCRSRSRFESWEMEYYKSQVKRPPSRPATVCEHCDGLLVYVANGHNLVCTQCGVATFQNYEELGDVRQFELRGHCAPVTPVYVEYNRNKHFRKVLRDVTFMPIRVPQKLIELIRNHLEGPATVAKVRAYLRQKKLFHYYTVANCIAHQLGDPSKTFSLNSAGFMKMCRIADALSRTFDRLRGDLISRKNFVNVHVLILFIATRKFDMPGIRRVLRLPRERTTAKHLELLTMLETHCV